MTSWQPNPESLNQLCGYLRDSLTGHDKSAQKNAEMVRRSLRLQAPVVFLLETSRLDAPGRGNTPNADRATWT